MILFPPSYLQLQFSAGLFLFGRKRFKIAIDIVQLLHLLKEKAVPKNVAVRLCPYCISDG